MQLAILLTLIHLRGPSLPDQRTALYDSYVERFFDREADKNIIVRENRTLLINIHGYLAWILHSEAEQGRDRGSVNNERLKRLLMDYLLKEDLDIDLAEKLSISTVDRICFLVSRVQGTFEFEVQPLREYFVARFLYKTAPHPSPGVKSRGTILDRFEAISMNFYWLNVTRFYAGFYNPGELPSLVYQLQDLAQKEGYCYISHPKILAATLLSDSVFAQHKRAMKDVLNLVFSKLGLKYFSSAQDQYSPTSVSLTLPKDCGQNELVKYCFAELHNNYAEDYVNLFCNLIKANSTLQESKELWYKEALHVLGEERTRWFHYGLYLQALPRINQNDVEKLLSDDPDNLERIKYLFRAAQLENVSRFEQHCKILMDSVLAGDFTVPFRLKSKTILESFVQTMNVLRYVWAFQNPEPIPLDEHWKRRGLVFTEMEKPLNGKNLTSNEFDNLLSVVELVQIELKRTAKEWATELSSWDKIVEKLRMLWGERWLNFHFANIASGIKSPKETCRNFPDLLDSSKSLCKRTRYARLRAGVPDWWKKQLETALTDQDEMFILLVLLTWGSSSTITHLVEDIDAVFNQMSVENWLRLVRSLKQAVSISNVDLERNRLSIDDTKLPVNLSPRTITALGIRTKSEDTAVLYQKYLFNYQGADKYVLQFCQETAFQIASIDPNHWEQALTTIENSYAKGVILDLGYNIRIRSKESVISKQAAEEIAQYPEKYPRVLVPLVEAMYREVVTQNIIPVGDIARNQHWFEE
ncbi:MAG TPA: hypothetical protein VNG51_28835 [Ktedonobacteraceae bacterium]|nr:hypothetical protein [Ktedonobacteraceae bacterium]